MLTISQSIGYNVNETSTSLTVKLKSNCQILYTLKDKGLTSVKGLVEKIQYFRKYIGESTGV